MYTHLNADVFRALLQSPFVPFIVLFCHIIETRNEEDLDRLGGLIGNLQSTAADSFSTSVMKELRLFKVLYDVACSYINLKADAAPAAQAADPETGARGDEFSMLPAPPGVQPAALALPNLNMAAETEHLMQSPQRQSSHVDIGSTTIDQQGDTSWPPGNPFPLSGDFIMEMDQQGTQFSNLLFMNHQMMRALEDGDF